jgi:hypothetical protein
MNDIDKRGAHSRWYFRDDRANCGIDLIRHNLMHAMHVVDDAMPLPNWMPPLWLIEIPTQRKVRRPPRQDALARCHVQTKSTTCFITAALSRWVRHPHKFNV